MNTIQRITKNVGVLFISQMVSYVLGFFTLMYSARYLGVEGYGTLSLALAFTGIFSVFMDLGLSTLTIREVARDKSLAKNYVANIMFVKLILVLITFTLIIIIVNLLKYDPETIQIIYLITFYTIFNAFSLLFYGIYQAYEKMEYQSIGTLLNSFFLLIGIFIAIYFKFDITKFSSIYFLTGFFVFFFNFILFSLKFFTPKIKVNLKEWKLLLKESWPFAVTTISFNLYTWIDSILISLIMGSEAVGLYNAAYKLMLILIFIPVVFNNALFPLMSQYYFKSKSLNLIFEKLFKTMILIGFPIGVGTVLFAKKIIIFIYGEQFISSVIVLQILIWSTILIFARNPLERLLESSNKQKTVSKALFLGLLFNVVFNIFLIPEYGYVGASIVTVLTDGLVLLILIFSTKKLGLSISKNTKLSLLKILISSLIMGLILINLQNLNLFILIGIGIITYIMGLFGLKTFDDNEINIIKSLIKK